MNIKVNSELINLSGMSGLDKVMPLFYNKVAERIAEEIPSKLDGIECEIHKENSKGNITVVASEEFYFKKSNFCCKSFEDSINLKK